MYLYQVREVHGSQKPTITAVLVYSVQFSIHFLMSSYACSSPAPPPFSGVNVVTDGGGRGGWEGVGGEGTRYPPGGLPRGLQLVTGSYQSSGLSPCFVAMLTAVVVMTPLNPSGDPGSLVNSCLSEKMVY